MEEDFLGLSITDKVYFSNADQENKKIHADTTNTVNFLD